MATFAYGASDHRRLASLARIAERADVPLMATNDVHYHVPERRPLQDVLTCIREKTTLAAAGHKLAANAERHLKSPPEMARLFRDYPDALAETMRVLERLKFISRGASLPVSRRADRRIRDAAGGARPSRP